MICTRNLALAPHARPFAAAILLAIGPGLAATGATAAPGGTLHTLLKGGWACEWPGDATTPPRSSHEDNFRVMRDSSYRTADGVSGNYLLLGKELTMTSGTLRGRKFHLQRISLLERLDAKGLPDGLRCVHTGIAGITANGDVAGGNDDSGGADDNN